MRHSHQGQVGSTDYTQGVGSLPISVMMDGSSSRNMVVVVPPWRAFSCWRCDGSVDLVVGIDRVKFLFCASGHLGKFGSLTLFFILFFEIAREERGRQKNSVFSTDY